MNIFIDLIFTNLRCPSFCPAKGQPLTLGPHNIIIILFFEVNILQAGLSVSLPAVYVIVDTNKTTHWYPPIAIYI